MLETRLENIRNLSKCAESRHSWQSVRIQSRQMRLLMHVEYVEKRTNVKDAVIKVVPRTDATTTPFTGRWVDTTHDSEEGQVYDAWVL